MNEEDIITQLKTYVNPKHYDLNDWETIYKRREYFEDGIWKYKLSFSEIYLYEDGTFYDVDVNDGSIYFSYNGDVDVSDNDKIIINELKSYCSPKDHELNDWDTIIKRATTDEDGITKYRTSYGTIYLDKNNNYYDVEPFEIDDTINILYYNLSNSEKTKVDKIKQYVLPKHYDLINWKIILNRVTKVKDNLFLYDLGVMKLYLDNNLDVVDYDRCHIINNQLWYDFNPHPIVAGEQYTYISDL